MSGIKLEYKINDKEIKRALKNMQNFNSFEMFDEIGSYLDSSVDQRFQNGVDPSGAPWQESNRAKNEGGKTLIDHSILVNSITHIASGKGVEQGTNLVYAAIHQFGGNAGRNKATELVARPFLGINADDENEINAIVKDFLKEALN